jgi:hypothetical protein
MSKWVRWEVEKSIELGKKVIATHSKNGAPKSIPDWISKHSIKVVSWNKLAGEFD